jgi:hypothetical protein
VYADDFFVVGPHTHHEGVVGLPESLVEGLFGFLWRCKHKKRNRMIAGGAAECLQRRSMPVYFFAFLQLIAGSAIRTDGPAGFDDFDVNAGMHAP